MKNIDYISIGEKIKKARIANEMSQIELATKCNMSRSYIGHIERGTKNLSLEALVTICDVLNLSCDYLLMDELPTNDATLNAIFATAKKHGSFQYKRFLTIIKALAEISDKL